MADYYVDINGNVSTNKKKKKTLPDYRVDINGNVTNIKKLKEDIPNQVFENIKERERQKQTSFSSEKLTQKQVQENLLNAKKQNQTEFSKLQQNKRKITNTVRDSIVQKPENSKNYFENGYQIGDVTKQILNTSGVALGTVADTGVNLLKGSTQILEGIGKGAGFLGSQFATLTGDYKEAERLKRNISNEDLSLVKKIDDWQKRTIDKYSVSGEVADEIVQSIGYTTTLMGANAISGNLANNVLMFLSSAGSTAGETYQKNPEAKDWQVWTKSIGSGAISVLAESLGGILGQNKVIGNVEKNIYNKLTKNIVNGAGKVFVQMGIDASSEAMEEFIEYAGNQILDLGIDGISKLTGDTDSKFYEKWDWENVGKDMAMAFASTVLLNGTVNMSNIVSVKNEFKKKGADITTPEAIAILARRIDLENNLNNQQQNAEQLQQQIIEKQERLKTTTDEREKQILTKTIESLNEDYNNITQQQNEQNNIQQYENENENNERYQTFKQSAIENNIDVNDKSMQAIFELADKRGVKVTFDSSKFDNNTVNAFWQRNEEDGTREVFLNPNSESKKYVENIMVHEMTHDMEGTEEYDILKNAVLDYSKKQDGYKEAYQEIVSTYSKEKSDSEFVANVLGEKLGNQEFIDELVNGTPKSKIRKVIDWIGSFINKLTGNRNEKLYWQDVKNKFEKAYNAKPVAPVGNNVKQSIETDKQYGKYWQIETNKDIFKGLTKTKDLQQRAYDYILNGNTNFETITDVIDGKKIEFARISAREFVYGRNSKKLDNEQYKQKMRVTPSIDDLINNADISYHSPLTHINRKLKNGFNNYQGKLGIDNNIFRYIVRIGKMKSNDSIFYDISLEYLGNKKGAGVKAPRTNISSSLIKKPAPIKNSISKSNQNVKPSKEITSVKNKNSNEQGSFSMPENKKYSKETTPSKDNKGRTLSEAQIERYKDISSKLKDENGNIKTYYHGTQRADRVGNYFDPNKATSGAMAFFTDNQKIAESYSKNKQDTSLSREYDTEWDLFKADNRNLDTYWRLLNSEKRKEIIEKGYNIGIDEDYENAVYKENASKDSFGNEYQYLLQRNNNNAIKALYELFINSGYFMEEDIGKFQNVLKYAGVDNVSYLDPYKVDSKVYEVYLNIKNPFDTSEIDKNTIKELEDLSKTIKFDEHQQYSADMWDKSNITPEQWIERLKDDFQEGTAHAWTSFPDWVTEYLKGKGYDGIVDTGGKNGGVSHQVVIPFYPNQIKNVDNTNPTDNPDIRYSQNVTGAMQKFLDKYAKANGTGKTIQQLKLPTKVKISDFENILNKATNIPDTDKQELRKILNSTQLNENALNDFETYVNKLDNDYKDWNAKNQSSQELNGYSQALYAKYNKMNTDYDRTSLENAKTIIPANKQGRRTKEQWLNIAKQIGVEVFEKSDTEIEEIAYRTWQEEKPNQKDVLNRQGKGYVKFKSSEWVQAVYDSVNQQRKYSKEINSNIQNELENAIEKAQNNKNSKGSIVLGKVANKLVKKVKSLIGIDVTGRKHILSLDNIKHMINRHGNLISEAKKRQLAINKEDILKIPDIINNYDDIVQGTDNRNGKSIRYIKKYNDNLLYVVEVVPEGSTILDIKTMWKKPVGLANSQQTPSQTPKAQTNSISSTTNKIIPQTDTKMQEVGEDVKPPNEPPINDDKEKVAVILTQPQPRDKKNNVIDVLKANVIDKGLVFEELDDKVYKKTGKRTLNLQSRWDYLLSARQQAQNAIGNRRYEFIDKKKIEISKSLDEIIKEVGSNPGEFYEYMYHQLNIDRMSLENKAQEKLLKNRENLSKKEIKALEETKNKPVFAKGVTAEISTQKVAELEMKYPEFKKYAQDVYNYLKADKMELVKNGVISQELSNKFDEMYPHYVPISRVDKNKNAISVPLDTNRTGINTPIKRAKGGNSDIEPLFETMANRTNQVYIASARNNLGIELKNALSILGSLNQDTEQTDVDTVMETISNENSEIVKKGTSNKNPTFTIFENGEKETFDITDSIYSTLKPVSKDYLFNKKIPILSQANDIRRSLITEYNLGFALTNPIKDFQDVMYHSEHPLKTYINVPEAIGSILTKGYWYSEYIQNGGSSNSYFNDGEFEIRKKQPIIVKAITFPLKTISKLNNLIEMTPRLAEYISSRKKGADMQTSMIHSARVTTNFKAGGDAIKFLNRNGATFLNASVQGSVQMVRDVKRASQKGLAGMANLIIRTVLANVPLLLLMKAIWKDDDDYEELSDYVKDSYYIVAKYGDGQFVRIPKGRINASVQKIINNVGQYVNNEKELNIDNVSKDFWTDLMFTWDNTAPNSVSDNNLIAPIKQAIKNESWYGEDIVPARLQNLPAEEQYDASIDTFSKFIGETFNISPYKVNYVIDQYSGVIGDIFLPMSTQQTENGLEGAKQLLAPIYDKFTVDSNMKNQNISNIYDLSDKLIKTANSSKSTDYDVLKSKYIKSITDEMGKLYKEQREIQSRNLSNKEKYEEVKGIQKQINNLAKMGISDYEKIKIEGNYADVNGIDYYKENGSWKKLSDEESEKLDDLNLNIIEKSKYLDLEDNLSEIDKNYKSQKENLSENSSTYDEDVKKINTKKKNEIVNSIINSSFNKNIKISLYKSSDYGSDVINNIDNLNIDIDEYMKYTLQEFKTDYDEDGKAISGSRKEKIINYVDSMNISNIQKAMLLRKEYSSYDDYNYEIINYIQELNITQNEKKSLLEYLNFKVEGNTISW